MKSRRPYLRLSAFHQFQALGAHTVLRFPFGEPLPSRLTADLQIRQSFRRDKQRHQLSGLVRLRPDGEAVHRIVLIRDIDQPSGRYNIIGWPRLQFG